MIGLIVIGLIAAYVAAFVFVFRKARNWRQRFAATAVAFAIPFWDLPIGYASFFAKCHNERGVRQNAFAPVKNILIDESAGFPPLEVLALGYEYVEYVQGGQIVRFAKSAQGAIRSLHTAPVSETKIQSTGYRNVGLGVARMDFVATRLADGGLIARQTTFKWRGMWWEVALGVHVLPTMECTTSDVPLIAALRG